MSPYSGVGLGHMDKWSVVAQKEGPPGPECILDPRGRGR